MVMMPFSRGSAEFAWATLGLCAVLTFSSFYVAKGEWRIKSRSLLGNKLLASSVITLLFGVSLLVVSIVNLSKAANSDG